MKAQSLISHNRQIKESIQNGTSDITKASVRRQKVTDAEKAIANNEVIMIRLNKDVQNYLDLSNSEDEAKLRAELERLRMARIDEKNRIENELALKERKRLDAIEARRHKEMMLLETKRKKEEAKLQRKKLKEAKKREKERAKAAEEKRKQ